MAFNSLGLGAPQGLEQKDAVVAENPIQVKTDTFSPKILKPAWVDRNNNGIADSLDKEIANASVHGTAGEYAAVIVMLRSKPTVKDANTFTELGGYLTTSPWTYALYGFGGQMLYGQISRFVSLDSNVLLVEKDQTLYGTVAYAAKQIGARTYVWNTMGLQGDPQSSIVFFDSGIDPSHPDFSPGYGNLNFSKKIIGWDDEVNHLSSPYDDAGHGSMTSGIAAGDGFFSTDASGNAIATWGENLGSTTTGWPRSGMMINKTGLISINVKWKNAGQGNGTFNEVELFNGNKNLSRSSWTLMNYTTTPNQDTWYSTTYNVTSIPSGGYDMYHIQFDITGSKNGYKDNFYYVMTISWPYTPPTDGFQAWTGIAPQTKLVEAKVADYHLWTSSSKLINAINWILPNRVAYHVVVASMSLNLLSESATLDTAVDNLADSGVTVVVAAGNQFTSYPGQNTIYSPGSVNEVITVGAIDQFDHVADYSSEGGPSHESGGQTIKPDIVAPGGSWDGGVPVFSADSNDGDANNYWSDVVSNDSMAWRGTSFSTPMVSGASSIIVQAMGGFSNWQYTRTQALQVKNILLMTATETYPNLRERYNSTYSPTLERGGKDVCEGYGRLNLDAAVDAVMKTYAISTYITDTLGKPPTLTDVSGLGQKLAWARKVQLNSEVQYTFTLTVPTGADFDLYLYNDTGTYYGEPTIVAKSTTAQTGGQEQITVTAPYTGTYYLVVKRATEATGGGTFTLTSHAQITLTVNISPIVGGSVSRNDTDLYYNYGEKVQLTALPSLGWSFSNWSGDLAGSTNPAVITMNSNKSVTATFAQWQYTLTVNGSPVGRGSVSLNNTGPYHYGDEVQLTAIPTTGWKFSNWSGDLTGSSNPVVIIINGNKTANATFDYHDIAVAGVVPSSALAYAESKLNVTVTVKNKGLHTESFNVTLFCNTALIQRQTVSYLAPNFTTTLNFTWNTSGYPYGYYTITANATLVQGETNTFDNTQTYSSITLTISGDINGDRKVDASDLFILSNNYGSTPNASNWNLNCDINQDNKVDAADLFILSKNYGSTIQNMQTISRPNAQLDATLLQLTALPVFAFLSSGRSHLRTEGKPIRNRSKKRAKRTQSQVNS